MPTIPARQPYQPPLKVRACYMLSQRAHHETDLKGFPALAAVDSQPLSGGASFMPITPSEILQWCTLCRVGWCQWLTQTVCARWGGMYPERERDIYIFIYVYIYIYVYMYDTYVFQTYHTSALEQVCCKAQCRHMCCPFGIVWPLKLPSFQINS